MSKKLAEQESKFLAVVHHPWVIRLVTALAAGAGVGIAFFESGTREWKVCVYVLIVAAVFGVTSPGLKGKPPVP